jgi:hypothetical protein
MSRGQGQEFAGHTIFRATPSWIRGLVQKGERRRGALLILMRVQSWILLGSLWARCTVAALNTSSSSGVSYTLCISCLLQYFRAEVAFAGGVGAMNASCGIAVACQRLGDAIWVNETKTVPNRRFIVVVGRNTKRDTNICSNSFFPPSFLVLSNYRIARVSMATMEHIPGETKKRVVSLTPLPACVCSRGRCLTYAGPTI